MSFILVPDIVEENGKTIRQNNLSTRHSFPLRSLVEIMCEDEDWPDNGVRLFVVSHDRDCDGSPLYGLSFDVDAIKKIEEAKKEFEQAPSDLRALMANFLGRAEGAVHKGYGEESLTLIKEPTQT